MSKTIEKIFTKNNLELIVEKELIDNHLAISLCLETVTQCTLHWGFLKHASDKWHVPDQSIWPKNSKQYNNNAIQTSFAQYNGKKKVIIKLKDYQKFLGIVFVLFFSEKNQWDNNNGKNYYIKFTSPKRELLDVTQVIEKEIKDKDVSFKQIYNLNDGFSLAAAVINKDDNYKIILISNINDTLILHWGIAKRNTIEWLVPPNSMLPAKTVVLEKSATESQFVLNKGINRLLIETNKDDFVLGIQFVLKRTATGQWLKNNDRNFFIPICKSSYTKDATASTDLDHIYNEIINPEMNHGSWTLMHRFNLCFNLLDNVANNIDGLAVIFVWLRFSSIRQLDWQRNYNTQPKELSHSQERLTFKLADVYINSDNKKRELLRLIFTTLGRGGEGQRIRDDILNIMHRHHIKEVSGHFMEEWHQKLHNNATPDDIVICQAYLEFLKSNGNLDIFYQTLNNGGVTKERLESFERPIVTSPDFVPHIKDGLIYDFKNYLKLLKSIHSGTDLESSVNTARNLFDQDMINLLDNILYHKDVDKHSAINLIAMITDARKRLISRLDSEKENHCVRTLIYLDLALEEFLRVVAERNMHLHFDGDQLVELIGMVSDNLQLSHSEDIADCINHWSIINQWPRFGHDWSLHARSILDRLERSTGEFIDRFYQIFQPKAEFLGNALNIDQWAVNLFSEEAVRGRPAFILSQLIRQIDPILRKNADIGNWQIISQGCGKGRLEIVDNLRSVQLKEYDIPTVIVADKVMGDEEVPNNIKAVITPDVTDIVSHVAVRARNSHLLFATCYDANIINHLKSLHNHFFDFKTDLSGNVTFEECSDKSDIAPSNQVEHISRQFKVASPPHFVDYVISEKDFNNSLVGGKSMNIKLLREKLPDWIKIPQSGAIPFGVFEMILDSDINNKIANQYNNLTESLDSSGTNNEILAKLRKNILELRGEEELLSCLKDVIKEAKMEPFDNCKNVWMAIKQVWASKWNDRAFLSRKAYSIPHKNLYMAVLLQQAVNAKYAFVIHTANPFSSNREELYAEIVLGLGETLVSNYPGRAMSFITKKSSLEPKILSFPSKTVGLFCKHGMIFRSDSNGEDLTEYAGAGIYDSIMLPQPHNVKLNYANEPLVIDKDYRNEILVNISKIGIEVENSLGGVPQDIEGVFADGYYYVVQSRCQVGI